MRLQVSNPVVLRAMLLNVARRQADSDGARLLRCIRTGSLTPLAVAHDWSAARVATFLENARYHRLDAFVADLAGRQEVPASLAGPLRQVRTIQAMRQVAVREDARYVARVLDGVGVPWVVLKGPVTAHRHHPRPQQRSYSDLDVLVRPAEFETAVEALVKEGAYLADRNWPLIRQLACGELNLLLPFGTPLDLHWDLLAEAHDRAAFAVASRAVVGRAVAFSTADGLTLPAIDPVDELLHLCLHAVVGGTNSLGRLRDIALIDLRALDQDQIANRTQAWGLGLVVAVALDRAHALFAPGLSGGPREADGGRLWRGAMRLAGERFPEFCAPPPTRWSSHVKLTRSSTVASLAHSLSELVGYLAHGLWRRKRDDWDSIWLQEDIHDPAARSEFFSRLT